MQIAEAGGSTTARHSAQIFGLSRGPWPVCREDFSSVSEIFLQGSGTLALGVFGHFWQSVFGSLYRCSPELLQLSGCLFGALQKSIILCGPRCGGKHFSTSSI